MRHKGCEAFNRTRNSNEGFSSFEAVASFVRIVYCHECGAVSTNVRGERDVCTRCGHSAERVESRRPWQSYASGVLLLAAAAAFVVGWVQDTTARVIVLVTVVAVAFGLSSWGLRIARERIQREIEMRKLAEEKA